MVYLLFFLGLLGLWFGAEAVTRGALGIARRIGLSETFIGVTILAIGTDLPEVVVSITGGFEKLAGVDTSGLIIGNIVGSTMGQIGLVLGLAGLIGTLQINKREVVSNGTAMLAAVAAFWMFAQDGFISPIDGIFMLAGYVAYMFVISNNERKVAKAAKKRKKKRKKDKKSMWWYIGQLLVGLVIVGFASHTVLQEGLLIAELLNVSPVIVGIIMIGLGTSLPELVVSITAITNGSAGLSVGNLIGSNIVDILLALGLSATIDGWNVQRNITNFDLPFLMVTSVVIMLFLLSRKKLERKEAILVLALYYGYIMLKLQGF